jgi:hypothetical protein
MVLYDLYIHSDVSYVVWCCMICIRCCILHCIVLYDLCTVMYLTLHGALRFVHGVVIQHVLYIYTKSGFFLQ